MKIRFFSPSDNEPIPTGVNPPIKRGKNQFQAWSNSDLNFLRDNWNKLTNDELAIALGRTKGSVQSMGSDLGLKRSKEFISKLLSIVQQSRSYTYTEAEKQYLRDNWQTLTIQQMADHLGRTHGSVKSMSKRMTGLKKTHEALSAISRRPNAGQFKKGSISANAILDEDMPIRIRHGHKKRGVPAYKWIRVAWRKWIQLHVWIWEQANGPAPEGMIIVFKNKDTMDCRLENLELITKKDNALRNSGTINLPDTYVAHLLAVRKPELKAELLNHPELLDLKRTEIQLQRAIKQHDDSKPTKTR